jgi:hypothetical protein
MPLSATSHAIPSHAAALMDRLLEVQSGCVFVAAHDDRWLLLWPEGYRAQQLNDGRRHSDDRSGDRSTDRHWVCSSNFPGDQA